VKSIRKSLLFFFFLPLLFLPVLAQSNKVDFEKIPFKIYPELNDIKPDLHSPFLSTDNKEFVIAVTKENKFAIIPVTLSNDREICQQLIINEADFPALAKTGLHSEDELDQIKSITGRSLEEITELGRPNCLSQGGFMAADEDVLSVIKADNQIVQKLGLTHPQLAKPLFHVLNMMDTDLALNRWNMARHRWENIQYFYYNNCQVFVEAEDTKGGQLSIFDDGIEGGFYIRLWREFNEEESQLLKNKYGELPPAKFNSLQNLLSTMNTGEIEPQYIMRYGFYEGHTYWRTDPITISFIFGLKPLAEIEKAFEGELFNVLKNHFTEEYAF
jgi:hypothetical protein